MIKDLGKLGGNTLVHLNDETNQVILYHLNPPKIEWIEREERNDLSKRLLQGSRLLQQYQFRLTQNDLLVICYNGTMEWLKNGKLHRVNGPAVVHPDGLMEYWINGTPCDC